jgi:hypothetical protein
MELQKTKNEFFKLVYDLKPSGQTKKSSTHPIKNFSSDFFSRLEQFLLNNPACSIRKNISYCTRIIPVHFLFADDHPPEKT